MKLLGMKCFGLKKKRCDLIKINQSESHEKMKVKTFNTYLRDCKSLQKKTIKSKKIITQVHFMIFSTNTYKSSTSNYKNKKKRLWPYSFKGS